MYRPQLISNRFFSWINQFIDLALLRLRLDLTLLRVVGGSAPD